MAITLLPKTTMMTTMMIPNDKQQQQQQKQQAAERERLVQVGAARRGEVKRFLTLSTSSCSIKVFIIRLFAILGILSVLREAFWQERSLMALMTTLSSSSTMSQDKHAESVHFILPSSLPVLGLHDLTDLTNDTIIQKELLKKTQSLQISNNSDSNSTTIPHHYPPLEAWHQAIASREPVLHILERAGTRLSLDIVPLLPKWNDDVTTLYGKEPIILGLETCIEFRRSIEKKNRHVGIAGQFNTGTNALAKYFWDNLLIRENPNTGMLANVPWHKHGWVDMRGKYKFAIPDDYTTVLPVVIVRDPYFWMESMCESPYLLMWNHNAKHCPNLISEIDGKSNVQVHVQWGMKYRRYWASLAHVWSEWYREYYNAKFPRLIIRFEDLLFHTPKVLDEIRQCAGAEWKHKHIVFTTEAIKQKKYFQDIKPQSSMLSAVIKYGQDNGRRTHNMTQADLDYARKHIDPVLMEAFHYQYPE